MSYVLFQRFFVDEFLTLFTPPSQLRGASFLLRRKYLLMDRVKAFASAVAEAMAAPSSCKPVLQTQPESKIASDQINELLIHAGEKHKQQPF